MGKILSEAARLFTEQGNNGIATLQIAGNAGVTEPAIYHINNTKYACGWRHRIKFQLTQYLKWKIRIDEFRKVPIPETVNILMTLINGLVRQQVSKLDNMNSSAASNGVSIGNYLNAPRGRELKPLSAWLRSGVREAAVSFCRWSLVNP